MMRLYNKQETQSTEDFEKEKNDFELVEKCLN